MATTTRKTPIKYRRGKPLPTIAHGDVLDWTTFRLHSKPNGRLIELCPKCGRKGEYTRYSAKVPKIGGTESYTHMSEYQTIFWFVRDSCDVALVPA